MLTLGNAFLAGGAYLAGWYALAFWFLAFAIVSDALATVWAIGNPDWYWRKRVDAGLSEHTIEQYVVGRRSFVPSLLLAKVPLLCALAAAAWYVGGLAGFYSN